ncbi:MAG TPA: hypothetical protein VLO31_10655 [Cryobacterium sp.]|nr:hypothetical protein [Cryobacterium sp.]
MTAFDPGLEKSRVREHLPPGCARFALPPSARIGFEILTESDLNPSEPVVLPLAANTSVHNRDVPRRCQVADRLVAVGPPDVPAHLVRHLHV